MEKKQKENLPPRKTYEDFERITNEVFKSYQEAKALGTIKDYCEETYLEPLTNQGGGQEEEETEVIDYVKRFEDCNKTAIKFQGYTSLLNYWNFLSCMRWWCERCGKIKGKIHRRRMKRLMEGRMKGIDRMGLRQFIMTVPEEHREKFQSRKGLNSLFKMAVRVIKKTYPGLGIVAYMHLFGDKDAAKFNPHVNIHVVELKGTTLKLLPEDLADIKKRWRNALRAYGCKNLDTVNVHYSFTTQAHQIKHRMKYMSRPNPGPANFKPLLGNVPLLHLCVLGLKGFNFIRYYGEKGIGSIDANDEKEIVDEAESFAGEKLIYCPGETMSRTEFNLRFRKSDYDELSPGFYRIKQKC